MNTPKLIFLLFILPFLSFSQNISVKSFNVLNNDMDARVNHPKKDQNGDKCAIIKVVTTEKGFQWEGDMFGIVDTENKLAEYWVYVPHGVKRLTISHPQLGMLRNYIYPISIKEATVYEMVLTTAKVTTIVEEIEIPMQWLIISSQPAGANIYINDQYKGTTPFQMEMEEGHYTYRMDLPLYHSEAGVFDLLESEGKKRIEASLKPSFGSIQISTSPENGATVLLDGKPTGKTTPCTLELISSGKHTVNVQKEWYQPTAKIVDIKDGENSNIDIIMPPTFGDLTVETLNDVQIIIDGATKGTGTWSGRLIAGWHQAEVKNEKYYPAQKRVEVKVGESININLEPQAKQGALKIMTTPFDAQITLNGKDYGSTPMTIKDLLIGEYILLIKKENHGTINKTISIIENQTVEIKEDLPSGQEITINSKPKGAVLSIDGESVGNTPFITTLSYGSHQLKLVNGKKVINEQITISQNGKSNFSFDVSEFGNFTEDIGGVKIEMIAVKGGTFQMGGYDGSADEKPVHSVTLDDFFIGKYEVTQAQWKKVMRSNPSYLKGDKLPVELVSWNDIQVFLKKLNQMTGKKYRLPTEAEWEYAAKGGASTGLSADKAGSATYAGSNNIGDVAWYKSNSNSKTHTVGTKRPNELGIYDMSGNVWEWCSDRYGSDYYKNSLSNNPKGPSSGGYRVLRGGSWNRSAQYCRSADRHSYGPDISTYNIGFRLVLSSQ